MAEAEMTQVAMEGTDRLVQGLREADPAAHQEFCAHYGRRLHRFIALQLRGDASTAEELMVQTLVEAVRHIGRFDPRKASFLAWLFGIARRQVLGELRQQRRRKSVPESAQVPLASLAEEAHAADPTEPLAGQIAAQQQVARLRETLSPMEMEVLLLHGLQGLSVREIGHVVGRSERAINSLLHRARQRARERLGEDASAS